jgi:hypothetical protein
VQPLEIFKSFDSVARLIYGRATEYRLEASYLRLRFFC